jgi:hypothetical protein
MREKCLFAAAVAVEGHRVQQLNVVHVVLVNHSYTTSHLLQMTNYTQSE